MKGKVKPKRVSELTPEELDAMSAEFDHELTVDTFGPLPPSVKARLERAKRKRGRPRVGSGSKAISVTVEKTLLRRVDRIVKLKKTTRAKLIAEGLLTVLAKEGTALRQN